jgi:putative ABC transport system ATP-binding protein
MVTHDSSIARRAPRLATIKAGQISLTEQAGARRAVPGGADHLQLSGQGQYAQQPYAPEQLTPEQYGAAQGH